MTRKRTYLYACIECGTWSACATRLVLASCERAGRCVRCQVDTQWREHVYIRLLELHLEDIRARARSLPENQRAIYRVLARKRQQQLRTAREQLEVAV